MNRGPPWGDAAHGFLSGGRQVSKAPTAQSNSPRSLFTQAHQAEQKALPWAEKGVEEGERGWWKEEEGIYKEMVNACRLQYGEWGEQEAKNMIKGLFYRLLRTSRNPLS